MTYKNTLAIVFIFNCFLSTYSQYDSKGIIFFKDGTSKEANFKSTDNPKKNHKIMYYDSDSKKNIVNNHNTLNKVRFFYENDTTDYYYKNNRGKILFLQKVNTKGALNLFMIEDMIVGNDGLKMEQNYYVSRNYDYYVRELPPKKAKGKFKKTLLKYTEKCLAFDKKLADKKYLKNKSVQDIVKFYNDNCETKMAK